MLQNLRQSVLAFLDLTFFHVQLHQAETFVPQIGAVGYYMLHEPMYGFMRFVYLAHKDISSKVDRQSPPF